MPFFLDEDIGLYILADGMGGQLGGGEASKIAVESIKDEFSKLADKDYSKKEYHELVRKLF